MLASGQMLALAKLSIVALLYRHACCVTSHPIPYQDQYVSEPGQVLEFDIYHADTLLPLPDEEVIGKLMSSYLPAALPAGAASGCNVIDSSVLR